MEQFASMKYDNDILVRVIVKKQPGTFVYNAMRIQRTDFPVLTCAISNINDVYRVSIGARPGRAIVIYDETDILKNGITEESATQMAEYVAQHVPTGSNLRGSSEYRTHLAKVFTNRNLLKIGGLS